MLILCIILGLCVGCNELSKQDIYKRPDWLPGKLYTTVSVQENLTLFTECLQLSGLDKTIDVSGSWTVFAPTDEAMKQYLSENQYSKISDIPPNELEKIAKFHIIQNPWSLEQLQTLNVNGWRTNDGANSTSYAYKRETILKNPVGKYWIKTRNRKEMIVIDSTQSDSYKMVYVESRKYVPVFYDDYFDINGLTSADFSFYFDRVYERGNVYYAGAKVLKADIFAENGFVHVIDRVVSPMLNAKELLEREMPGESYKLFLEMVYWYYPDFEPNITATFNQPAIRLGGQADTLWDLNYARPAFTLHNELTGYKTTDANETLVKHNGLFVPTDDAFSEFIDGILTVKSGFPHWTNFKSLPQDVVGLIVNQHFKSSPIYPSTTQYNEIFRGKGRFPQNEGSIIRKEFGSNCSFIGFDKYIPDRVFTSVTGPVLCRPDFSIFRLAMQYSGVLNTISDHKGKLYFFPIPDYALMSDSSLMLNWIDKDKGTYNFMAYNRLTQQTEMIGSGTVKNWILNHVGTLVPNAAGNKETFRTLGGKTITWDHSNNTIRGTQPCTIGYKGMEVVNCTPFPLDEPADNGKTWAVSYWFNF